MKLDLIACIAGRLWYERDNVVHGARVPSLQDEGADTGYSVCDFVNANKVESKMTKPEYVGSTEKSSS